jgi:hypothetical protein
VAGTPPFWSKEKNDSKGSMDLGPASFSKTIILVYQNYLVELIPNKVRNLNEYVEISVDVSLAGLIPNKA